MYEHNSKAGNQGDVVKHAALVAAVDSLLALDRARFFVYADCFAGSAHYPLIPGSGWAKGIGKLPSTVTESANKHVAQWRSMWPQGKSLVGASYPGSSAIVCQLVAARRMKWHAHLWDISPSAIASLRAAFAVEDATVHGCPVSAGDVHSCTPTFVLVDPPGPRTAGKPHYPSARGVVEMTFGTEHAMIWMPIIASGTGSPVPEIPATVETREVFLEAGLSVTTVRWSAGPQTCGCRVAFKASDDILRAARDSIDAVVELMPWSTEATHESPA
jgi:23S rRNA A2030 N6-methylase RlmJ